MHVRVELQRSLDVDDWAARHATGLVPDRWPYGLHRLGHHGITVSARRPISRRAGTRIVAAGLRKLSGVELVEGLRPRGDADVVLAWDERSGVPAAAFGRYPVVMGVIWASDARATRPAARPLIRRALRRAAHVWCLSAPQVDALAAMGAPTSRLHWLPFGVDADFWVPAPRREHDLVLSVGNDRHRDWPTVLQAIRGLRSVVVSRHVPAGPGVIRQVSHGELRSLYHRAGVVVVGLLPNLHVSGVTVVLEAMACGQAPVVTATPGMADYVRHGENGLLIRPGDAAAMRRAIRDLIADPQRADEMGRAARKTVDDAFTTERMAGRLADIVTS